MLLEVVKGDFPILMTRADYIDLLDFDAYISDSVIMYFLLKF